MGEFLKVKGAKIYAGRRAVTLKGVNLGGWLMMEGYILHAPNIAERAFKKDFARACGQAQLRQFEEDFRKNFVRETDIRRIARLGFNCIRVPFNSRLIEAAPYRYSAKGIRFLDRVLEWASKYKLYVILDMHAACGAQSFDWHADSLQRAELWEKKELRKRTVALWGFLADRYQNSPTVAGYDILNEAVAEDTKLLNVFYRDVIRAIRKNDSHHILFVEGNKWARDLNCLDDLGDDNLVLSVHFYDPLDFTFNFVPQLSYPLKSFLGSWGRTKTEVMLARYQKISRERDVPIFVGEFGVNARDGLYGEDVWVRDILACFKKYGFHWTYWTYKAVKNNVFPDGMFSYFGNPPWVHRQGPRTGWETYAALWPEHRKAMIRSWRTDSFKVNTPIVEVLKNAAR